MADLGSGTGFCADDIAPAVDHVYAVDFLPECTAGSDTCPADADIDGGFHQVQDRLRTHAAISAVVLA